MPKMIRKHCAITPEGEKLLENAITRLGLSARAHDRILKVARTTADLGGGGDIEPSHLGEAIQYRTLDRSYWLDSSSRYPSAVPLLPCIASKYLWEDCVAPLTPFPRLCYP